MLFVLFGLSFILLNSIVSAREVEREGREDEQDEDNKRIILKKGKHIYIYRERERGR